MSFINTVNPFERFHVLMLKWSGILTILLTCIQPVSADDRPIPVGVSKAVERFVQNRIELPGTVLPWHSSSLAAEIDGRVEKFLVEEGDYAKKGAPLVRLRTHPLKLQLQLAEAEKRLVEARLEELRTGTRPEVIDAAKSDLKKAEAKLRLAENEHKRLEKLYKAGVVSLEEYDRAAAEADQARAELAEKQAVLEELVKGPRIEKIKQEEANLEAARARIKIIRDDIQRATIYAPFDGYVAKKETEVGQWLEKGDPALTLISTNPLKIEVNIPQFHFTSLQIGDRAEVLLESYNSGIGTKTFKGTVIEKIPSGDPVSRTFPVRIKVTQKGLILAPGMLVRVIFKFGKKSEKKLFVPKDAIVRTPRDTSVWVARKGNGNTWRVNRVKVQTGENVDSLVAVHLLDGNIKPGEWVVVQGNERLKPNAVVHIVNKS